MLGSSVAAFTKKLDAGMRSEVASAIIELSGILKNMGLSAVHDDILLDITKQYDVKLAQDFSVIAVRSACNVWIGLPYSSSYPEDQQE